MASPETFEIEVENGTVRGALHKPEQASAETPVPAVLVCRGVFLATDTAGALLDDICNSLVESGLGVARFEHRCARMILDDFDAHRAIHDIEDAMATLRWLLRQPMIDRSRVGVVGYSLGAIAATAVVNSMPSVARLCLLNAATADYIAHVLTERNGSVPQVEPGLLPASYAASLGGMDSAREAAAHERVNLVLHAAGDRFISAEASQAYVRALLEARRNVEYILVPRADHAFSLPGTRAVCVERISTFFSALVGKRAVEPASSST